MDDHTKCCDEISALGGAIDGLIHPDEVTLMSELALELTAYMY